MTLALAAADLRMFKALLQRGVATQVRLPRSVLGFLTQDLRLTPEYVRQRITTVFLDGDVVDVLEDAALREGSRLALSAAMPGLVGATLRRSGPYAAMRAEITRPAEHEVHESSAVTTLLEVKLFNLLIDEIGPVLLERGVLLEREAAAALGLPVHAPATCAHDLVEVRVRFG